MTISVQTSPYVEVLDGASTMREAVAERPVLPFLTGETVEVLPWINASLAVGVVANVVNLIFDRAWLKSFGDLGTTSVGLAAMIQLWAVFPFDIGDSTNPWIVIVRTLLVIAIAGSAIGIAVAAVALVRALIRRADG